MPRCKRSDFLVWDTECIITKGPIQGLRFVAARRVHYSEWFWNGTCEKEACNFLQTIIPANGVCYDIGAALDYHVFVMAEAAENGHVYAFEPIPQVCEILQENINLNMDEGHVFARPKDGN